LNELDILVAYNGLVKTKLKLILSNDEIKQKYANRSDLIESMNESIDDLENSILKWKYLERETKSYKLLNSNLTDVNLKLILENRDLKKELDEIKVNLDYINQLEKENQELKNKLDILIKEL